MDDLETLLKKLQGQAIEDASRLDPEFAERVAVDRREIEEHQKTIEAQRNAKREQPRTEYHTIWELEKKHKVVTE